MKRFRLYVLDMDGTFYLGGTLFPGSLPFLDSVAATGGQFLFLTNNSSRTAQQYVEKLQRLGVPADGTRVLTSADATVALLRNEPGLRRLHVMATPAVAAQFADAGFVLESENPQTLVLTYDTMLTYEKLKTFCLLVRRGLPYVATHPDFNCPDPEGPLPDIGAYIELIHASTGRRPDRVVGKPNPGILEAARMRFGATQEETLIIGDRLYTDIQCGINAGVASALVLTGETTREMLDASSVKPTYVFDSLGDIGRQILAGDAD